MCHSVQAKCDTESSDYRKPRIPRSGRGITVRGFCSDNVFGKPAIIVLIWCIRRREVQDETIYTRILEG
jgi:hypothetical protein